MPNGSLWRQQYLRGEGPTRALRASPYECRQRCLTAGVWFGLLAPAGTPSAIVSTLNTAVNERFMSAGVRTSPAQLGMEAKVGTSQDFAAALDEPAHDWKTVIAAIGFKAD